MIEIKHKVTGKVLFTVDGDDLRGANLRGADLREANLRWANLRGSAFVVYGFKWPVYITNGHIRIGCQSHDLNDWKTFTDAQINDMDYDALTFWHQYKEMIISLCEDITKPVELSGVQNEQA